MIGTVAVIPLRNAFTSPSNAGSCVMSPVAPSTPLPDVGVEVVDSAMCTLLASSKFFLAVSMTWSGVFSELFLSSLPPQPETIITATSAVASRGKTRLRAR